MRICEQLRADIEKLGFSKLHLKGHEMNSTQINEIENLEQIGKRVSVDRII